MPGATPAPEAQTARLERPTERSQAPAPRSRAATFRSTPVVAGEGSRPSRREPIASTVAGAADALTALPKRQGPAVPNVAHRAPAAVATPSRSGTLAIDAAKRGSRPVFGTKGLVDKSAQAVVPAAAAVAAVAAPPFLRAPAASAPVEGSPKTDPRRAPVVADRRREAARSSVTTPTFVAHAQAGMAPVAFAAAASVRHAPAHAATRSVLAPMASKPPTRASVPSTRVAAGGDGANLESASSSPRSTHEGGGSAAASTPAAPSQTEGSAPSFAPATRSHAGGMTSGAQQSQPQPAPGAPTPTAVPVPSQARSLHELAAADPSLTAAAIGKNAHLRLETGRAGDLTMHLRINDGVADIEVGGAAAEKLGMRSHELRRALAGEGLTLGQFHTRPAEVPPSSGDDRSTVPMATAATMTAASSAGAPSNSPPSSFSSSSSSSSSSSFNQDHRQNQPRHGADTAESGGPASAAANGARARSAAAATANEGSGVPRRGLHVTA